MIAGLLFYLIPPAYYSNVKFSWYRYVEGSSWCRHLIFLQHHLTPHGGQILTASCFENFWHLWSLHWRASKFCLGHLKSSCQKLPPTGRVCTLLSSSNSMTFRDFLHDLFNFSKTMGSAVIFKNSKTFPCLRSIFDHKQFNRHQLWCPPICVPFTLFNYCCLTVNCHCLVIYSN